MRHLLLFALLTFACPCVRAQVPTFSFLTTEQNDFVKQEVSRLTLPQKAGQMTQVAVDVVHEGPLYYLTKPAKIDEAKISNVLGDLAIGSVLNHPSRTYPTPQEWRVLMQTLQEKAMAASKVPLIYGIDAIHGPNYVSGSTLYAQPLGVAASFNRELTEKLAAMTAYELRASSIPWNFSPAMDVGRNPLWPRTWESFGEDTYLNQEMGLAMLRGYQGKDVAAKDKVVACLKHFTGYGSPFSGRDRTPSYLPERQLREIYFPQYRAAIEAGALSVMINSGEVNGVPVHASKWLLTDVLRDEMGFEGLLVSDWQDVRFLHTRHKIAPTLKDAVRMSIEAGMDMSMTAVTTDFPKLVVQLVNEGKISRDRIDLSVARIIAIKVKAGLYERAVSDPADYPKFGGEEFARNALQSAEEAIVLLKNDGLPLPIGGSKRVLLTGPTASTQRSLNGGWTFSWQGNESDTYLESYNTIAEAMEVEFGQRLTYVPGVAYDTLIDIDAAVRAAENVDVIVACVGELSYTEDPGNINDANLPEVQRELIMRLTETGKPLVLVMASGRPRVITELANAADAILFAPYPGPRGGDALARILAGDVNPSGKLPLTYPRSANSSVLYDHKHSEATNANYNPLFEFGAGIGYATFSYGDINLSAGSIGPDDNLTVSVNVTNEGEMPGKHAVLLFTADEYASITPSVRRLRDFTKIELAPGESRVVNFTLTADDLSFIGLDNERVTEAGAFRVMIGGKEASFEYAAE